MNPSATYLRSLNPQLPRPVWVLQGGGLANSIGNGIVLPFLVIYLRDVRGISVSTAGLVVGVLGAMGLVSGPIAGALVDRVGARATLAVSLVLLSVGYGLLPLVRAPWHAFALAVVAGAGNGSFWPSQSTLISRLTPPARRHAAFAQQRVTNNLGIGLGGVAGGLIATTAHPGSFTILFLADAVTFLAYVGILAFVPSAPPAPAAAEAAPGRYLDVLRNRIYLTYLALNATFVAVGFGLIELFPFYAKNHAHVTEREIGILFFVNTMVIVVAQLPIAKALEGRRRMPALALMGALWAVAWLIVMVGGIFLTSTAATAVFAVSAAILGLGECFHGTVQAPLVVDLAEPRLLGRYLALSSMSWQLGLSIAPAAGGVILKQTSSGLWAISALVALAASAAALALERRLPREARRTPAAQLAPAEA